MVRSIGNVVTAASVPPTYTVKAAGTSGTYTSPTGCSYIIVEMTGGGGGGGINTAGATPGGGGGSSRYQKLKTAAGTYSYSVGSGGAGGTTGGGSAVSGSAGGDTTFGTTTCGGGTGGGGTGTPGTAGTAVNGTGFTVLFRGDSQNGMGGSGATLASSSGGGNQWSVPQPPLTAAQAGTVGLAPAAGYGGGGAGSNFSFPSATAQNGGAGLIVITEYY